MWWGRLVLLPSLFCRGGLFRSPGVGAFFGHQLRSAVERVGTDLHLGKLSVCVVGLRVQQTHHRHTTHSPILRHWNVFMHAFGKGEEWLTNMDVASTLTSLSLSLSLSRPPSHLSLFLVHPTSLSLSLSLSLSPVSYTHLTLPTSVYV